MLGVLTKTNDNWVVNHSYSVAKDDWETLPLHPEDVKQINRDAQVFDNIEARIAAYPEVEFDRVSGFDNNGPDHFPQYAKLLNH